MVTFFKNWWDNLHAQGALFLREMVSWLPGSNGLTKVVNTLFIFSDISKQDRESFDKFYNNVLVELLHLGLWFYGLILILSWPFELFLFEQSLVITYTIWRSLQFLLIVLALLNFSGEGALKKNGAFTYFFLASLIILITGFCFGRIVTVRSPWFAVIYALPFLSLPLNLKLCSRILVAFYFPMLYMASFVIFFHSSLNLDIIYNTTFLLFYDAIVAGGASQVFFNITKSSFFHSRRS